MAVKPSEMKKANDREKKLIDEWEQYIDEQLRESYPGHGDFKVKDRAWEHGNTGRIVDELRHRYNGNGKDGWDVEFHNNNKGGHTVVLKPISERPRYSCSPWD